MRMRRAGAGLPAAGLVVAVLAAGCSTPVVGAGGPAGPSITAPAVQPPPGTTEPRLGLPDVLLPPKVPLPPRTRDVSVAGLDPCAVLTPAFAESLGFDLEPGRNDFVVLNGAPGCTVSQSSHAEVLTVIFVTTVGGIDIYNRAQVFSGELTVLDVAGFPALLVRPTVADTFCNVAVDISAGEMIEIQVGEGGRKPPTPLAQLCASAQELVVRVVERVVG